MQAGGHCFLSAIKTRKALSSNLPPGGQKAYKKTLEVQGKKSVSGELERRCEVKRQRNRPGQNGGGSEQLTEGMSTQPEDGVLTHIRTGMEVSWDWTQTLNSGAQRRTPGKRMNLQEVPTRSLGQGMAREKGVGEEVQELSRICPRLGQWEFKSTMPQVPGGRQSRERKAKQMSGPIQGHL
jgi:hypothetical protein